MTTNKHVTKPLSGHLKISSARELSPLLLIFKKDLFILFCVYGYFVHVYMHTMYMPGASGGQRRAAETLRTGITDGLEPLCRCWELNAVSNLCRDKCY